LMMPEDPWAASQAHKNRIRYEVKPYSSWDISRFKMTFDCVADVILQFPQIFALSRDAAVVQRVVPRSDQKSRFVASLDLKYDFVHAFTLLCLPTPRQLGNGSLACI
jgi:hypothetical protein